MDTQHSTKGLKIFAGLGVLTLFLVITVPTILAFLFLRSWNQLPEDFLDDETASSTVMIGELGSTCGGEMRLPCKPGLECSVASDSAKAGTCQKVEGSGLVFSQFGETCGTGRAPCTPGLYCRKDAAGMSCAKITETAPYIVSTKLEGLQQDNGMYHGKAGTKVRVLVQASGVESATMGTIQSGTADATIKDLGALKKDVGGKYTGEFTLQAGFAGDLLVTVLGKNGEFSALSVRIAALP